MSRTRREAVLRILDAQGIADKICEAERIIHLSLFVNFYFINLGLSVQTHKSTVPQPAKIVSINAMPNMMAMLFLFTLLPP